MMLLRPNFYSIPTSALGWIIDCNFQEAAEGHFAETNLTWIYNITPQIWTVWFLVTNPRGVIWRVTGVSQAADKVELKHEQIGTKECGCCSGASNQQVWVRVLLTVGLQHLFDLLVPVCIASTTVVVLHHVVLLQLLLQLSLPVRRLLCKGKKDPIT